MEIAPGDQVFIRGDKESGKSRLCMGLALGEPLVVLDPKHEPDEWLAYARRHSCVVTRDPAAILQHRRVVVLVDQLWLDDREGWRNQGTLGWRWTQTLHNIWTRRNSMVVFEEAIQTLPSTGANARARRILTQGRVPQLTSLIPIQVTNWVDTLGPRLAGHYVSFACQDQDELKNIRKCRGVDPGILRELGPHEFAHHRRGEPSWTRYPALPAAFVASLTGASGVEKKLPKGVEEPAPEIEEETAQEAL